MYVHRYRTLQVGGLLSVLGTLSFGAAQDPLHFTSGITNPAPQPGQPFTLTWAGGDSSTTVYIVLDYLFPNTPNQVIPYIKTDILSHGPNNGSWTYNVPSDIFPGRYTFDIGINPLLLSDSTGVFTIVNSIPSSTVAPSPTSTASSGGYNGCGLPPLNDYTYTGYQPPCTYSTNGHIETIYPVVPSDLSSSFYGPNGIFQTNTHLGSLAITPSSYSSASSGTVSTSSSANGNTAFASGVFAQVLQCSTTVTPTRFTITASGTATVLSEVDCAAPTSSSEFMGVCHASGYTTFSVSGTNSVCCPEQWATTPLNSELYCYTSMRSTSPTDLKALRAKDVSATTGAAGSTIAIDGLAFTRAGVVSQNASQASSTANKPSPTASDKSIGGKLFPIPRTGHVVMASLVTLLCRL